MDLVKAVIQTDHYQPHRFAKFEGYYSKFDLPSGARLIFIICTVPRAPGKRHNITLVHIPKDGFNVWKREFFPEDIKILTNRQGFEMSAVGMTARMIGSAATVRYECEADGIKFHATTSQPQSWTSSWFDTPAGPLAWLPLPLHWHVHSLASQCSYTLSLPAAAMLASQDKEGHAIVHEEKNWANSFPPAHNWIQGRTSTSTICLAGGRTMGVDAFLAGYRNKTSRVEVDFRPPFALKIFGLSPFMTHRLDWESRSFYLSVQDFSYKLEVSAKGQPGTFFGLTSPMSAGFTDNFMGQSLNAEIEVKLYRSTGFLFGKWEQICTDSFDHAALEFGAQYYPPRGTSKEIH